MRAVASSSRAGTGLAGGGSGSGASGVRAGCWRIPGSVGDLVAVLRLQARDPVLHRRVLLLLQEGRLDRVLDLLERGRRGGLDRGEDLDDVPAELGLDRLREIAGVGGEDELVERRNGAALEGRELAAVGVRTLLRVLLGELGEIGAGLDLVVELLSLRLRLHQDL